MDDDVLRDFDLLVANEDKNGVFVVNEGNFMYSNASLTYYNKKTKESTQNVFYYTNALPLGDVAQSMTIQDSLGYVVLNNSGKIYILNTNTFEYVGKITGLTSPRYIHFVNSQKAYVSDLYAKAITIVDPISRTITGTIDVNNHVDEFYQHSTEQMLQWGKYVFVNCWSYDNKILVIDTQYDTVVDSIEVRNQPNSMAIDNNNMLWVLSDGGSAQSPYPQTKAAISKIDLASREIVDVFEFDNIDASPTDLCINSNKDTLYFIYNDWGGSSVTNSGIYRMSVAGNSLPQSAFISDNNMLIYSLAIDPYNSDIYIGDAIDQIQNGTIYRYNASGQLIDTFKSGIAPGGFCFK
jgi:hypothetical protein